MKTKIVILFFVLVVAHLIFAPTKVQPESWNPSKSPKLEGIYAKNDALKEMDVLFKGECPKCEDIAIDSSGNIYGAAVDGRILKFVNGKQKELANTNGRPLGLHFDTEENLIVCDAQKGLLSINRNGDIEVLATTYGDAPFLFTDDADISKEGLIYFSDASNKFHIEQYKLDFFEHGANGRLLTYDPKSKQTTLLLDNLYFANGVAISENEDFVLVNETSSHQVKRYWLKGEKAGSTDLFLENLPFYPDGISRGENGIFWVAMQSPRNGLMDALSNKPFLRKVIARVPNALLPKPKNYSFILGVDEKGNVKYNLQDPDAGFAQITSIQQFGNKLYLGSLYENGIGVYSLE